VVTDARYRRTARRQTDKFIVSVAECVQSECSERDGLRQHCVAVGSTAEEQTPAGLSPRLIKSSGTDVSVAGN